MKFIPFAAAASLLLAAAPANADVTTAPSTWQLSQFCQIKFIEVNTRNKQQKELLKTNCTGVNVSVKNNINVHFSTVHPSLSKPALTFVLTEGPYRGSHPVETAVTFLGHEDQAELDSDVGFCNISKRNGANLVNCVASSVTRPDGKYLMVLGVASFQQPLAPEIMSALR